MFHVDGDDFWVGCGKADKAGAVVFGCDQEHVVRSGSFDQFLEFRVMASGTGIDIDHVPALIDSEAEPGDQFLWRIAHLVPNHLDAVYLRTRRDFAQDPRTCGAVFGSRPRPVSTGSTKGPR